MTNRQDISTLTAALFGSLILGLALSAPTPTRAQAPDPADIAEGLRLFQQKGNCQACHGWSGDGRKTDNQMPDGANLRASQYDRETLTTTIKCGRPGTGMPAFDRLAYSDDRCFGLKQADLRSRGLTLADPPATLAPREINMLVDFLLAKVTNKGTMDHAACVAFWGSDLDVCKEFAK